MSDCGARRLVVLDDVDDAAVGQLRDRQVRHRIEDTLLVHCLGELSQLGKELESRLRPLATVDVAAGCSNCFDLAVRAIARTQIVLMPSGSIGSREKEV